jgi:hypothetical protein
MITAKEQALIDAYLNEQITEEQFAELEAALLESSALRNELRRHLSLDSALRESIGRLPLEGLEWQEAAVESEPRSMSWLAVAAAAVIAFGLGILAMMAYDGSNQERIAKPEKTATPVPRIEPTAAGFAVVHQLQTRGKASHEAGETLMAGNFELGAGSDEIRFYCGARVTVAGPARLQILSAWQIICLDGNLRVEVPPAARGFKIKTPGSEIIDMGTEFGLQVRNGNATVRVLEGGILVKHGEEAARRMVAGESRYMPVGAASEVAADELAIPDHLRLEEAADEDKRDAFARWQVARNTLAKDPRLIAYYDFEEVSRDGIVANLAHGGDPERRGAAILAASVSGRWPGLKRAVEFRRAGSRMRVHLAGEFSAYTFAAWVRIDSLDRWYNALLMGDGFETGEPHWQIREDGAMMLSVMVDSEFPNPKIKRGKGKHRNYYSPPIWDQSKSGTWMHLASVFDTENRRVSHYVDGELVSRESIKDDMFIDKLRIGNAEIGNWGEPFRRDEPVFAIRNLNGRIDELAAFDAALDDDEIRRLYEAGR